MVLKQPMVFDNKESNTSFRGLDSLNYNTAEMGNTNSTELQAVLRVPAGAAIIQNLSLR